MRATNANKMRENNVSLVLNCIRQGGRSRTRLAAETGLTKAAVSVIVDGLLQDGWIRETALSGSPKGRPSVGLELCPDARYLIGVDISRGGCAVGLMDLAGRVIAHRPVPGRVEPEDFFSRIPGEIADMLEGCGVSYERIYGVGVTTPGPVDSRARRILNPPDFAPWHGAEIGERLEELLGLPVYLENIANACALGEKYFGAAQGCGTFMTLLIDEGIGSGIVAEDRLFNGRSELGHTSICPDGGIPCSCGNVGCLERYASVPALLAGTGYPDWETAAADPALVRREAHYLSVAITNVCNLFDLERIILTGDVRRRADALIAGLTEELRSRTLAVPPPVVAGQIARGTVPSATVALHRLFSTDRSDR